VCVVCVHTSVALMKVWQQNDSETPTQLPKPAQIPKYLQKDAKKKTKKQRKPAYRGC